MNFYIKSLFIVIPIFFVLIIIEWIISKKIGLKINRPIDIISSLSSGMSNITKDSLKLSVVLVSYTVLVEHLTIYKLEPIWLAVLLAFLVQDFSGYWMHRLNHRVNIFWNRHVIHHSSEEFNLSCALRQSISETVHFSALLMIPAALFGVSKNIFSVLAPIHLFMQFWYHTRLIDKMGFLEKIIITPSHHRVHHAINPEYIDKNYGQILIIWDKIFGSFQPELKNVEPLYGILRPAKTWNPILINFKHLWQLIKDAYYTKHLWDKFRIWFMPTGWRPLDVKSKHPIQVIQNPLKYKKFYTSLSIFNLGWAFFQQFIGVIFMIHFFSMLHQQNTILNYFYGAFILVHIFSYTSLMDQNRYSIISEIIKLLFCLNLIQMQEYKWFGLGEVVTYVIFFYLITSLTVTTYLLKKNNFSIQY